MAQRLDHVGTEAEVIGEKALAIARTLFEGIQILYAEINTLRAEHSLAPVSVPTKDDFINRVKHYLRS